MALFNTNKWSLYKDASNLVDYSSIFIFSFEFIKIAPDPAAQWRQVHWAAGSPVFVFIDKC